MEHWKNIELDNFNGPLDLLLHMVKEKQVDIMDVNLLELSNQYIEYIKKWNELDVEIASEYLTMAAYLVELKSKLLIPKEVVEVDSDYEDNERNELLKRLVEYHKIKEVSEYFKTKQLDYLQTFSKPRSVIKITKVDDDSLPLAPNKIDIDKFAQVFLKILEKNKLRNPVVNTITSTEVSPEEVAEDIKTRMSNSNKIHWTLEELIAEGNYNMSFMVATFLAILELAKYQFLRIIQKDDDVEVVKVTEEERKATAANAEEVEAYEIAEKERMAKKAIEDAKMAEEQRIKEEARLAEIARLEAEGLLESDESFDDNEEDELEIEIEGE